MGTYNKLSNNRVTNILDKMIEIKSFKKTAKETGECISTVWKIAKENPLWEWARTHSEPH